VAEAVDWRKRHLDALREMETEERRWRGIEQILRRGNGADRQLRVFNANRDIVEVTREIAQLTEISAVPVTA